MRSIAWESLDALVADGLEDLAVAHWEEAEDDHDDIPLALDLEKARFFEKAGQQFNASLRADGELVGYATFQVMTAMFHRFSLHAFCIGIYVDPAHRGFGSLALIRWCERELAAKGVVKLYLSARNQRQCDLFQKMGYKSSETVHTKLLGAQNVRRRHSPDGVHPA